MNEEDRIMLQKSLITRELRIVRGLLDTYRILTIGDDGTAYVIMNETREAKRGYITLTDKEVNSLLGIIGKIQG